MKKENSSKNILNVPLIQKEIKELHHQFISNYGSAVEKVMADHRLFGDIIFSKLYRIALIFKEENIIDDIKIIEEGSCKKILQLSKKGFNSCVNVATNGVAIILEGFGYTCSLESDFISLKESFFNVNTGKMDWVDFSTRLLNYIHANIYGRKEAIEVRLDNILIPEPDEKIQIIENRRSNKDGESSRNQRIFGKMLREEEVVVKKAPKK